MRVLCSTFGSSGDVFPMLGLAIELQRRGHEVTLATNEYYRAITERNGICFEPIGSAEDFRRAAEHPTSGIHVEPSVTCTVICFQRLNCSMNCMSVIWAAVSTWRSATAWVLARCWRVKSLASD